MRKISLVLTLAAVVSSVAFAHDPNHGKACDTVAKACMKAGYTRAESATKGIWDNCMKPLMLGQTVKGVNVDSATTETCRTDRIAEIQQELKELQDVKAS